MFVNNFNLKKHNKQVHENIKAYKCDCCEKTFGQKANLKEHFKRVHDNVMDYKCDYCEKHLHIKDT